MIFVEIAWDALGLKAQMDGYWSCNVFGHSHAVCFQAWKVYVTVGHPWTLAKTLHVWPEGSGGLIGPKSMYPSPPHVCIWWVWGEEALLLLTSWGCSLHGHCWWDVDTLWLWHCGVDTSKCLADLAENVLATALHPVLSPLACMLLWLRLLLFLLLVERCDLPHPKTTNSWRKLILLWAHPIAKFVCLENHMRCEFPFRHGRMKGGAALGAKEEGMCCATHGSPRTTLVWQWIEEQSRILKLLEENKCLWTRCALGQGLSCVPSCSHLFLIAISHKRGRRKNPIFLRISAVWNKDQRAA